EIGDEIQTGDVIGTVGNTGYVRGNPDQPVGEQGCHLHFEIRSNEDIPLEVYGVYPIDPELLIMYSDNESPLILSIADALALGYGAISNDELDLLKPVHRYLNTKAGSTHYYILGEDGKAETDAKIITDADWAGFKYEGIAFYAFDYNHSGLIPEPLGGTYLDGERASSKVYRFKNETIGEEVHFYVIGFINYQIMMQNISLGGKWEGAFTYEEVAFCAYDYESGNKIFDEVYVVNTFPVHRFLNNVYGSAHFYTINEKDKLDLINKTKEGGKWEGAFTYETIAFWAYPISEIARNTLVHMPDTGAYYFGGDAQICDSWKRLVYYTDGTFIGDMIYNPFMDREYILSNEYAFNIAYTEVDNYCESLGYPAGFRNDIADGVMQEVDKGAIYHKNGSSETWAVYGEIYDPFSQNGGIDKYGYPETGVQFGCQTFENVDDQGQKYKLCVSVDNFFQCLDNGGGESCVHPKFGSYVMHPLGVDPVCGGFTYMRGYLLNHNGVDMAKEGGCRLNSISQVKVTLAGIDIWSTSDDDNGNGIIYEEEKARAVTIDHGGIKSIQLHVEYNTELVEVGDVVDAGTYIGVMGCTGLCSGTHLHLMINEDTSLINPEYNSGGLPLLGDLSPSGNLFNFTKAY
ncbi:MAG: M23 family metallopeptidase, partial [Candidatus Dojkabacteria bacterium]|nr:M23 family metallopeptidase [Candidatus Dojkabacteria bacterium]